MTKTCACGNEYTRDEFMALPAPDKKDRGAGLVFRHCECGSTIAIPCEHEPEPVRIVSERCPCGEGTVRDVDMADLAVEGAEHVDAKLRRADVRRIEIDFLERAVGEGGAAVRRETFYMVSARVGTAHDLGASYKDANLAKAFAGLLALLEPMDQPPRQPEGNVIQFRRPR